MPAYLDRVDLICLRVKDRTAVACPTACAIVIGCGAAAGMTVATGTATPIGTASGISMPRPASRATVADGLV